MAAYTIQEFITRAEASGGISLSIATISAAPANGMEVKIGDQFVNFSAANTPYQLGNYFTAVQVLSSYDLRSHIVQGAVVTSAGTTSLSCAPVNTVTI